jgi:hypothetical protein
MKKSGRNHAKLLISLLVLSVFALMVTSPSVSPVSASSPVSFGVSDAYLNVNITIFKSATLETGRIYNPSQNTWDLNVSYAWEPNDPATQQHLTAVVSVDQTYLRPGQSSPVSLTVECDQVGMYGGNISFTPTVVGWNESGSPVVPTGANHIGLGVLKVPPIVNITSPQNRTYLDTSQVDLNFTVNTAVALAEYKLDNGNWTAIQSKDITFNSSTNVTYVSTVVEALPEGVHVLVVRAKENDPFGDFGTDSVKFITQAFLWKIVLLTLIIIILAVLFVWLAHRRRRKRRKQPQKR